jgi:hypothetical protein
MHPGPAIALDFSIEGRIHHRFAEMHNTATPAVHGQRRHLSLPKIPAGHPNPFDQLILAETGVLTDSPSYHRNLQESTDKTRPDGSLPRKARRLDEKVCFWLANSAPYH